MNEYFVVNRDLTEITLARVLSYDISNTRYLFGASLVQNSAKFSLRESLWAKKRVVEL